MRSKLNPDGTRIRILRIQRGWTQDQLAEIAGVSTRTIQRAETANCASFETLRAVAGAFETDFDQLLRPQAYSKSDPEPHIANPSDIPGSEPEIKPIPVNLPEPQTRRIWAMSLLSMFTLVLGLATGIFLTPHFDIGKESHSPAPSNIPVMSPQTETFQETVRPVTVARDAARRVPFTLTNAAVPLHTAGISKSPQDSSPAEPPAVLSITADSDSEHKMRVSQATVSLDLSLQSHSRPPALVVPESLIATKEILVLTGNRAPEEPSIGAVRLAVDLAAKKTGTFVSKVGTSIKRVF